VTGTHTVYLTGNYVLPIDEGHGLIDGDDDEDDEYDLSPDEDELDLDLLDGEESDDLDDLENPRIAEVDSDDEVAPRLVQAKGKNKRAADDSEEGASLDDLIAKDTKAKAVVNGDSTLSKKQQKKRHDRTNENVLTP